MDILNVEEMTRIAVDAAHEQSEALEVIGVTLSAGGGNYARCCSICMVAACHRVRCRSVYSETCRSRSYARSSRRSCSVISGNMDPSNALARGMSTLARVRAPREWLGEGGHL